MGIVKKWSVSVWDEKKFDINNYNKNYDNFKTNSVGFRDYEFSETKERNIKRILVFGDSITVGTDSIEYQKDLFSKQMENIISKDETLKYKYQVYNMGVDGYNTVQEAENLRLHVAKYKPDIVIVTYCLNDGSQAEIGIYYQILSTFKLGKIGYFLMRLKLYKALCQILFDKINLREKAKVEKNVTDIGVLKTPIGTFRKKGSECLIFCKKNIILNCMFS